MKKLLLSIHITCCCIQAIEAQTIRPDSSFAGDGVLTTTLTTNNQYYGTAIQVQDGGEIIACGHPIGSPATKLSVSRFLPDGQSDFDFNFIGQPNFQGYGTTMGLQDDGKILCGVRTGVVRLLSNGLKDNTFGNNGFVSHLPNFDISDIVTLPNGKIVVVGDRNDDPTLGYVFRVFNDNGTPDNTFSSDGKLTHKHGDGVSSIMKALAQPDGKILAAGDYYLGLNVKFTILRLTPEGEFDPSFGVNGFITDTVEGHNRVLGMALQPDGKILVTGYARYPQKMIVLRYSPNGTRDSTFGIAGLKLIEAGLSLSGHDVLVKEDGKILILGQIDTAANTSLLSITQLLADGTIDSTFGNNGMFISNIGSVRFGPCTMFPIGSNKVVVGANSSSTQNPLVIGRFILDLNVGTLNPKYDWRQDPLVYPNPIADHFTLKFALEAPENLSIELFDLNGKCVKHFYREQYYEAGEHHQTLFLGQEVPSGNYIFTISSGGKPLTGIQVFKH